MQFCFTTVRTCSCLHSEKSCRSHLSTGHTVDCVVYEDKRDVLATVECVDALCGTDTSHVAVALICEYEAVRPQTLNCCSKSGSTSVCCFLPVDVDILICKHCAAYGADTHCLFLHAHLFDDFGYEFVYDTV